MATSTILEPIKVNDEAGAQIIVDALEKAENTSYKKSRNSKLTTDPDAVRKIAAKAMAGVSSL